MEGTSRTSAVDEANAAERIEAQAFTSWHESAPTGFAAEFGVRVVRIGDAVAQVAEKVPFTLYNRVLGLGTLEPATPAMFVALASVYDPAGVRYAVVVSPEAEPPQLLRWLEERGFTPRFRDAKWVRGTDSAPDIGTSLRIVQIRREHAADFARVAGTVFEEAPEHWPWLASTVEQPGWRHYLAIDGDTPVATAAMFVRNGAAWAGWGATLESHRGRGAQGALLARRIRDAATDGCRLITSETAEDTPEYPSPSYRNMARAGFRLMSVRTHYIHGPAT
jgi:hypothetical protein